MPHRDPEKRREYYAANREKRNEYQRTYAAANRDRVRNSSIKYRYGITAEEYDALLSQPCAICGYPSEALDHDHATNENREALCGKCNRGLGMFNDNPSLMRKAIEYLIKHGADEITGGELVNAYANQAV